MGRLTVLCIPRVLAKIVTNHATGLLIIPQWTTQLWFPQVLNLLIQHPQRIASCKDLLQILHQPLMVHPLYKKLSLLAIHLSGRHSLVSDYRLKLQPSSRTYGDLAQECNMIPLQGCTRFCTSRQVHPMSPTIYDILAYLTSMFECGLTYHTISAAKSVLHIPGVTAISEHPLKGIFHVCPPQPRYELIWDTDLVLSFLTNLRSLESSLKFLSLKTVTLLTLLSGQRVSTVHQFRKCRLFPLLVTLLYQE